MKVEDLKSTELVEILENIVTLYKNYDIFRDLTFYEVFDLLKEEGLLEDE